MRTVVALENANCARCHNAMLGALRGREGVRRVWSDFSSGCLVIEYEADPDALVSLVTSAGRAVAVGGNGERTMVFLDGHEALECPVSKGTDHVRSVERLETASAASSLGGGGRGYAVPSPSGTRSPAATVSRAALSGPPGDLRRGGGAGVRVLSRERPAPGLVLRAVRLVARMFRIAFRLTPGPPMTRGAGVATTGLATQFPGRAAPTKLDELG